VALSFFEDLTRVSGVGNAGRNILRSDGLNQVDFGIIKNTRLSEYVGSNYEPICSMPSTFAISAFQLAH
jgi:hypothetical protein